MKRIPPWGIFVAFCGFITLLAGISLAGLVIGFLRQDLMAFGVTFAGHPLSGLTKAEAEREIARYVEEKLTSPALGLSYEDKRWEAAPADIGLSADVSATVEHAFSVGREGSAWQRGTEVLLAALRQRDIPLAVRVDQAALDAYLAPIEKEVQRQPQDAVCNVAKDGKVLRHEAVEGRKLDAAALADEIKPALYALRLPARVVLAPETTPPQVTTEDVAFVDAVLGVYTTYYVSASNRGENIEIAAASLNHRLIKSGASFSFNDVVGKRVAAAGYLTAPVIVDGKVEED
ncbi:MAG: peptidoglycan binding domain-containing protein, partial [Schwartzia sp. (in: firmicutes)]